MSTKQKIVLVADFYPPFTGGSELQIQLLGRLLQKRGHEVHVVTLGHRGLPTEEEDDGLVIHRLKGLFMQFPFLFKDPARRRYHPPFPDPIITWALRRLFKTIRPDIVHSFGWITYSCCVASLGMKIPFVVSARDFGYICARRTMLFNGQQLCESPHPLKCLQCAAGMYGLPKATATVVGIWLGRALLRNTVDAFHTSSRYVRDVIHPYLTHSRRVSLQPKPTSFFVIPNISLDVEQGISNAAYLEKLPATPFILFVGALQPHKGIYQLLSAYAQLHSAPPLVLMGTVWPDSPSTYPHGVIVIENVPHDAVMEAWKRCAFGVIPSLCPESFGNVIVEAMSQGKAVVASNIGGPLDIVVNEMTGLLVPPGDEKALALAMQRLIDDQTLCKTFGLAGRARSKQHYSIEAVIPQYESFYRQILDSCIEPAYERA